MGSITNFYDESNGQKEDTTNKNSLTTPIYAIPLDFEVVGQK